jgi:hypothetical protein
MPLGRGKKEEIIKIPKKMNGREDEGIYQFRIGMKNIKR